MKKLISLMLSAILVLSMGVGAYAADDAAEASHKVTASYIPADTEENVISVDIQWEGMDFTYVEEGKTWNAEKHQYEEKDGGWEEGCGTITITNNSGVILRAELSYVPETAYKDITMAFTDAKPYIGSAYTSQTGEGRECTVQVLTVPKGKLTGPVADLTHIGTVQVTVEAGATWVDVAGDIENSYNSIKTSDGTGLERGSVYYSEAAAAAVKSKFTAFMDLVDTGTASEAEINGALNPLITAYYNGMKLGQ